MLQGLGWRRAVAAAISLAPRALRASGWRTVQALIGVHATAFDQDGAAIVQSAAC